ncbi:MAG: metallophosphoesterase [Candidatus Micrarchaeota archaeon]|nr:metallophosphoesterase [Candidatus Micrarchaeota archaeon]
MDIQEINQLVRQKGKLLKPGAAEALKELKDQQILELIEKLGNLKAVFVSETDIRELTNQIKKPDFVEVKRSSDFHPTAKEYGHDFKIFRDHDVTGRSKSKGEIEDFVKYFNDRYRKIRELFISRPNNKFPLIDIEKFGDVKIGDTVRVVGIVSSKSVTKNKHLMLQIEDPTGSMSVLILNSQENVQIFEKGNRVVNDEVLAFDIKKGTNLNIVVDIIWPDLPFKEKKRTEKDIALAFISDIHVGSSHFMSKNFENMLKWLNGTGPHKEIAEKIGYLLLGGDLVDGIGIYPNQDKELIIKDVYEQYKVLNQFLELVPDHIQVIAIPGNHDAVRHAEPQPALGKEMIIDDGRTHSVGNPAFMEIEGFKVQMYHGYTMESLVQDVQGLSLARPEEIAIELLKTRNMSPIFDKSMIVPEHKDYMFIEEIDMFLTGHIHKIGYGEYRGCVIMNGGTWIDKTTAWQLRRGFSPTPAIMGVYDMKNARVTHVDFSSSEIAFE